MKIYIVKTEGYLNGAFYRAEEEVAMTEAQAKWYLQEGRLVERPEAKAKAEENAPKEPVKK